MSKKTVPFSIIKAAQAEDAEAVAYIRRHFQGYIASKCLVSSEDEFGNTHRALDDELVYLAESALLAAIFKFRFLDPGKKEI